MSTRRPFFASRARTGPGLGSATFARSSTWSDRARPPFRHLWFRKPTAQERSCRGCQNETAVRHRPPCWPLARQLPTADAWAARGADADDPNVRPRGGRRKGLLSLSRFVRARVIVLALVSGIVVFLPGAAHASDWSQFHAGRTRAGVTSS